MTDMITELRTWLERARTDAPSTETALENAIAVYQGAAGAITALQLSLIHISEPTRPY